MFWTLSSEIFFFLLMRIISDIYAWKLWFLENRNKLLFWILLTRIEPFRSKLDQYTFPTGFDWLELVFSCHWLIRYLQLKGHQSKKLYEIYPRSIIWRWSCNWFVFFCIFCSNTVSDSRLIFLKKLLIFS